MAFLILYWSVWAVLLMTWLVVFALVALEK